jgi:hypothetical protein
MDNNCTVSDSPVKVSKAVSYTFHFKPYGWAIYTVNETTGEFHITSDWGSFSHRWDPKNLGEKTFQQFLIKAEPSYICRKFAAANKELNEVVDEEETLKAIKTRILEDRRSRFIPSKEEAELLLSLAEEWADADFSEAVIPSEFFDYSYEDFLHTKESYTAKVVTTLLLPAFQSYLKESKVPNHD